jgi:hypothetical protein
LGLTNASGLASGLPIGTILYSQAGTDYHTINADPRGPFQIIAQANGRTKAVTQDITRSTSVTLTLN